MGSLEKRHLGRPEGEALLRTATEALLEEDTRTEAEKKADRMKLEQALRTDPALRGLVRSFLDGLQEQ